MKYQLKRQNLQETKWNKSELLPLTSDLKKMSVFLGQSADTAYQELQVSSKDRRAYNLLKEVLYTHIILLNRRRPAEVAQLKMHKYNAICSNALNARHTEFESCLTEAEKNLVSSYSRIVIRENVTEVCQYF
nr:unnamed protein product [Callosobruchus analis]